MTREAPTPATEALNPVRVADFGAAVGARDWPAMYAAARDMTDADVAQLWRFLRPVAVQARGFARAAA
jgi:hypothetical protein